MSGRIEIRAVVPEDRALRVWEDGDWNLDGAQQGGGLGRGKRLQRDIIGQRGSVVRDNEILRGDEQGRLRSITEARTTEMRSFKSTTRLLFRMV